MALGAYLLWGSVIGLILLVVYVLVAAGTPGERPDLGRAIGLLFAANGVTASVRLFVLVFTADSLGELNQTDRIYLLVGAIAALWLSLETIGRTFVNTLASEDAGEEKSEEQVSK